MKRHLIGIGGVGMSALATVLVRLGDEVTGADRNLGTDNIAFLESLGIRCFPDDGSGVDAATDEVIVSTAIEQDNPGLVRARELGIPVTHRAKALSRTLSPYRLVAVVGTCGKSSVTAMLGHILTECGLDPICVNGANVPGWLGAVRMPNEKWKMENGECRGSSGLGLENRSTAEFSSSPIKQSNNLKSNNSPFAVAEVDESDKSLVAFKPYAAIVTNASADHYSKAEMDEVFDAFIKDCPGPVIDARGETYAPELFNEQNASLAIRMAVALGCDEAAATAAMSTFRGVERRLQVIGAEGQRSEVKGQTAELSSISIEQSEQSNNRTIIYDDYAHNPEKLRSMWLALARRHPGGICVVWRPHGYAPLRKMLDALAETFAEVVRAQDQLLLLPVYDAGGTTDRSINSDALAAKLKSLRPDCRVEEIASIDAAYDWMAAHRGAFAALVTAGARDPDLPRLARRLAAQA